MIAQAEFCPAHLGAIIYVVEWTIREIGRENFEPGDVVLHNDPFRGGCHLPEYCVIKPVFYEERTRRLRRVHRPHDGGRRKGSRRIRRRRDRGVPGGHPHPAAQDRRSGDEDVDAVWNIILANVRTPRMSYGDMKAMIGSLHVGEQRVHELARQARDAAVPRRSRKRSRTTRSDACAPRSPRCRTVFTTLRTT